MRKKTFPLLISAILAVVVACSKTQINLDTPHQGNHNPDQSVPQAEEDPNIVDLGLSVLWASCNLGASSPEEYGDYCGYSTQYALDDKYLQLSNCWRLPSASEFQELINNCKWKWTELNGVCGYSVTSKIEGYEDRSIFLPAAGYGSDGIGDIGTRGRYWTSTDGSSSYKKVLNFGQTFYDASYSYTSTKHTVRLVSPLLNSNCYIVKPGSSKTFDAVKGNSRTSVGNVTSTEILWESVNTNTKPAVGDVIKSVSYNQGKIRVDAGVNEGNAVVAVKDNGGEILWSWHIWVTSANLDDLSQRYDNGTIMMDRNLGALSNIPGDSKANGLLYQWGRKDPFLGCVGYLYYSHPPRVAVRAESTASKWPSIKRTFSDESERTDYFIKNPMTFVSSEETTSNFRRRWDSYKTIYDPCPAGWRVPDGGKSGVWFTSFTSNTYLEEYWPISDWDSENIGVNFGATSHKLGLGYIWYPAANHLLYAERYLDPVSSKEITGPVLYSLEPDSAYGEYWSCTYPSNSPYCFSFKRSGANLSVQSATVEKSERGLSVRCQRQ